MSAAKEVASLSFRVETVLFQSMVHVRFILRPAAPELCVWFRV